VSQRQEVIHRSSCESCGTPISMPLLEVAGIDPLYDMRMAAYLIPMRYETLKKCLGRHRELFPPLYRLQGRMHRRIRVLSGREIKLIRALSLRGKSAERVAVMEMDATVDGLVNMPRTAEPACLTECPAVADPTPQEAAALERELLGDDDEDLQGPELPQDKEGDDPS
jgi:hypothetical protein